MITINSRKYDGAIHRSWQADLVDTRLELIVLKGVFENTVKHAELGTIEKDTVSHEYYWLNAWYNIFKFESPEGRLRNFYCNITLPPSFDGESLDFIDLDIDLLVDEKWSVRILDEQEFETNCRRFRYSDTVIDKVHTNVRILEHMIKTREFPFNI
jgi:protein associated with RNAse G/E